MKISNFWSTRTIYVMVLLNVLMYDLPVMFNSNLSSNKFISSEKIHKNWTKKQTHKIPERRSPAICMLVLSKIRPFRSSWYFSRQIFNQIHTVNLSNFFNFYCLQHTSPWIYSFYNVFKAFWNFKLLIPLYSLHYFFVFNFT